MNNYALTLLMKPDLEDEARKDLIGQVTKKVGKSKKEDLWGVKTLSFPIRHQNKAYYAHFEFEAEPDSIKLIDKNLKLDENIIRYLLVRI